MRTKLATAAVMAAALGLATSAMAQQYRFVVVAHGQASDPFWSVVKNGVDEAAKDLASTSNTARRTPSTWCRWPS